MNRKGTGGNMVHMPQSGPDDNGQTALAMVLTSLGCPVNPWELEPVRSAADLVSQARARGVYAEGCRMTVQELCAAPLPAIAHWHFRSFVVVSRVQGGRIWVHDPEEGLRVMALKEFEAGFTGAAVCFAGQGTAQEGAEPPRARIFFARFPADALLMGIAQVFISMCCVMGVVALRLFAGGVSGASAPIFLISALGGLAAALFQAALLWRCERSLRRQISRRCAAQLENKSPLFFRQVPMYCMAFACESCGTAGAAGAGLMLHTMQLGTAAVCLMLLAVQDSWTAMAALLAALGLAAAAREQEELLCAGIKQAGRECFLLKYQAAETMDRLDSLRGVSRQHFEQWLYGAGSARTTLRAANRLKGYWCIFAVTELALVLGVCLLHRTAEFRPEVLTGCAGAALCFAGAMAALPRRIRDRAMLRAVQETFDSLFREDAACTEDFAAPPALACVEELTVQNADLPPAREGETGFRDLRLHVRRGEVLSVQVTGGDRLALSRLIAGIVRPSGGAVYLSGVNMGELREEELYRFVTLLGRGIPMPCGTVRENIAAGCGDISDFAVVEAASDALLHTRILLREKGYDTPAGQLSGGEQMLLEFACAFARGTPFLVADACTECLDPETEEALMAAARARGTGVVLVTDGARLFRGADAVCRIEEGRVTLMERTEIVDWEGQMLVQSK